VILVRDVTVSGVHIPYDRYDNMIFCDAGTDDDVYMDYVFRVPTEKWPSQFAFGMISELASLLADGVQEDADKAQQLMERAQLWFIKAQTRDSQAQDSKALPHGRFINNRRSGVSAIRTNSNST
jgi:hypothetical protein